MTDIPGLIFRWLHVIPAIVMVGGVIFMRCCLVNSNATESGTSLFDAQEQTRKRWGKMVMLSTLLILGSGLYNACLLYTSPSPRDLSTSRMPSSA